METNKVFETCILCGKETNVPINMHIDYRTGYIEGAGQLCYGCYSRGTDNRQMLIPVPMVYNTPNDQELGAKVRQHYWNIYGKEDKETREEGGS